MAAEDPATVCMRALHVLLHNPDPLAKKQADDWLHQFQQTPEAWQTADQMLHTPLQDGGEAWYFAAQTIRTKIWNDFEQLPKLAHASLRDSLLSHVVQRADGAANVLTQLCLALSCLAVRMRSWERPIHDVHARLGASKRALLEFLTVLPETVIDSKLSVDRVRKREVRAQLLVAAPGVYELLAHLSQSDPAAKRERVLRCVLSWFRLTAIELAQVEAAATSASPSAGAARDAAVAEVVSKANPLVALATEELFKPDDECFEVAVDVCIELVRLLTGEAGDQDAPGLGGGPGGEAVLVRQARALSILGPLLERLGPQLRAHEASGDEDAARGLCRLFAEAAESCAALVVNVLAGTLPPAVVAADCAERGDGETARRAAQLAQTMLVASAHPAPEIAEISFNFWFVAMHEIVSRLDGEVREAARRAWAPAYLSLARTLVGAMVLPADAGRWSADSLDDFRRFRYACADGLSDAFKVAGGEATLGVVVEAVRAGLAALSSGAWQPLDGALHAAKALASHFSPAAEEPIASLLGAICGLPLATASPELLHTAVLCASGYAPWLHAHPERLGGVLSFASSCLSAAGAHVAPAACIAIKNVCDACCEDLCCEPWVGQLLALVLGSADLPLASADRVELLQGAGLVYSLLPVAQVAGCLSALATPMLERLAQLCAQDASAPASSEVTAQLDQLVALARYCQPAVPEFSDFHPISSLLNACWPLLCLVHTHLARDSRCMEKLCRVIKFSVRTASSHVAPLMPQLLEALASWFEAHAHSCFLYMVHVCASTLAGHSQAVDEAIFATYSRMSARVVSLLQPASAEAAATQAGQLAALGAHPDVLEDFFELSVVLLGRFPNQLLLSASWPPLAQLVAPCALLQHKEAWRACLNFAERLLGARVKRVDTDAAARGVLDATAAQVSPLLARQVLLGVAGMLPQSHVPQSCAVLRAVLESFPEHGPTWIRDACAALPPAAHTEAAPMLEVLLLRAATEREVRNAVDAFSEACRRRRLVQ